MLTIYKQSSWLLVFSHAASDVLCTWPQHGVRRVTYCNSGAARWSSVRQTHHTWRTYCSTTSSRSCTHTLPDYPRCCRCSWLSGPHRTPVCRTPLSPTQSRHGTLRTLDHTLCIMCYTLYETVSEGVIVKEYRITWYCFLNSPNVDFKA